MMYNQKLVASVKCAGKIMREQGETVFLPFGEEYSLLLKNLSSQKAVIQVEIDGRQVIPDGLVLHPNVSIDLERFIVNSDLNKGPRFRFIEKTEQISDYRGDTIDDGIIRISYQFEMPVPYPPTTFYDNSWYRACQTNFTLSSCVDGLNDVGGLNDVAGITVNGSESNQKFQTTSVGTLESTKHVIVLNLKGQVDDIRVKTPVTVDRRIKCNTCGNINSSSNTFCGKCGTNLTYQY